jgi:hypothetical protein
MTANSDQISYLAIYLSFTIYNLDQFNSIDKAANELKAQFNRAQLGKPIHIGIYLGKVDNDVGVYDIKNYGYCDDPNPTKCDMTSSTGCDELIEKQHRSTYCS